MDNKITKKRLSDFLAYEWILTLVAAIVAIVVLELVFTVSATRLTTGQQFKIYYDYNLYDYYSDGDNFYDLLNITPFENGKTFSYDVLEVGSENLQSNYDVLSVRLSVQEGDVIFTSSLEDEETGVTSRAKSLIDSYSVYDFQKLLTDAKEYLSKFVKDGGNALNAEDLDEEKIVAYFNERMKNDKRFRTEEQKAEGRILEIGRIKKLAADVADFEKLLSVGDEKGLFFRYTKYQLSADGTDKDGNYKKALEKEIEDGRENAIYGLNLEALDFADGSDKKEISRYFKLAGKTNAENVVLLIFDFKSYQPDLQFETISFIDTIVRSCSDLLD